MVQGLRHRGPDDEGVWSEGAGVPVLGHRRLAILDPSPSGHQPMVAGDGRHAIVLNGEIYNFRALRGELEGRGITFRTETDTEVLLQGYRTWGAGVLERLVGMYAFAIWDGARQELFLARDRFGEKPLYYASHGNAFAFASELAPLEGLSWVDRTLDRDALALYLAHQYVPAPLSILVGVRKLPPGHAMVVTRDAPPRIWRYWDPVEVCRQPKLELDRAEAESRLSELLDQSVRGQMVADVPLGAFLSGGIDSTLVVSRMMRFADAPVETFTIGFGGGAFDESSHAQAVAEHLGTRHTVEHLAPARALALIGAIPAMYGEPFADSSALPMRLVSEVARSHVTVSLSGDGGDELFGGYSRYRWFRQTAALSALPSGLQVPTPLLARAPQRLARLAELIGTAPKERYRRLVSLFSPSEVRRLTGRTIGLPEFDRAWSAASGRGHASEAMLADLLTYLPGAILTKVDRAAMAVSLETRAPFLDHRLAEFALRLPPRLLVEKSLLKALAYQAAPRALLDRPKQGFAVPLASWFRGELRGMLLETLRPEALRRVGLEEVELVEGLLREHQSGRRDHSSKLWALLVLVRWSAR